MTTGASSVTEVASSIIGIVGTSELATPGELVLVRNMDDVDASLGAGSIRDALYRVYNNYTSSQTAICLPLGKASDFTGGTDLPASGVSGSSADITLYFDSALTSPQWAVTNPHGLPVTYASSDETVLTVSSAGALVPVTVGDATVTLTVDGGDAYASDVVTINVTVADDADIPADMLPSGACFNASVATMYVAQPATPVTLINPVSQPVTWSVSDTSIATVDSATGEVTPLAAGSVTLTASLAATSGTMAVDVTCSLTVADAPANPLLAAFIANLSTFRKSRQLFGASPKIMLAPDILSLEGAGSG